MTVILTVKLFENATVKTCSMVNVRSPNIYGENCNRHFFTPFYDEILFLEVKKNVEFTGKNHKLTFPEFPSLFFKFDVKVEVKVKVKVYLFVT